MSNQVRFVVHTSRVLFGLIGAATLVASAGPSVAQPTVYTKFVAFGETLPSGDVFNGAFESCVGPAPSSRVVVIGQITPGARAAVMAGPIGGPPAVLARGCDQPPGVGAGVTFTSFNNAWADSSGRVLIDAVLTGTGVTTANNGGLWYHDGVSLRLVMREGNAVSASAGLPIGTTIAGFNTPSFSNGRVVFAANLAGSSITAANDRVILLYDGTNFSVVAREGSASGVVAGVNWSGLGEPLINASGRVAFQASLNTGLATNNEVIVSGIPGSLDAGSVMIRDGAAAPSLSGVTLLGPFAEAATIGNQGVSLNNSGEVAMRSGLAGTGVNTGNDFALYNRAGQITTLVSREGDIVPGVTGLPQFAPSVGPPEDLTLGGQGVLTWSTIITGLLVSASNDREVIRRHGVVTPVTTAILRGGTQAPGEASGVTFGGNSPEAFGVALAANALGQVLVRTTLIGTGISGTPPTTLWANDPVNNETYRVDRAGVPVTLIGAPVAVGGPGPVAATFFSGATHNFAGTQLGRPTALDDLGGVVFSSAQFSVTLVGGNTALTNGVYTTNISVALPGACCRGATCSVQTSDACLASSATARFVGSGTLCNTPGNRVTPCCFADFNGDQATSVQDIFDFLAAYFASDSTANINADAGVTVQDIFDYLAAYFAGCA